MLPSEKKKLSEKTEAIAYFKPEKPKSEASRKLSEAFYDDSDVTLTVNGHVLTGKVERMEGRHNGPEFMIRFLL